jgi:myo-inositol-1(or 4)-monophosphatase
MRRETETAIAAVRVAQDLLARRPGADQITSKGGIDLVTGSDLAAEDTIRAHLTRAYPDYPVVGEERGGAPTEGRPHWLVDPICGTRCFASGVPLYCVNVALVEDGRVTVAAIGDGSTGQVHWAELGGGAWQESPIGWQPLTVNDRSNTMWVAQEFAADFVRAAILSRRWYVWMFSSTLAYPFLAAGRISGIVHFRDSSPVHIAAGCLLVTEAGAILTGSEGQPWDLHGKGFVAAATETLHGDLLRLVASTRTKSF